MKLIDQAGPHGSRSAPLSAGQEDKFSSLCSVFVGDRLYGIDTGRIREVLGQKQPVPVPHAPPFIAGIFAYRGDVLTVVSFRALLGLPPAPGCILVLKDAGNDEPYGLLADRVAAVMSLSSKVFSSNPAALDEVGQHLYSGAFRMEKGLLVLIDPDRLRPSELLESGLFGDAHMLRQQAAYPVARFSKENACVS